MTARADDGRAARAPQGAAVGVVSPHYDDAVLSCGRVLSAWPGSHVVTVCSGGPWRVFRLPAWDRATGMFSPGADVIGARRREDDAALAALAAVGHRLDFWDSQYLAARPWRRRERARAVEVIAARLASVVAGLPVRRWLVPLGLVHPDHVATAAACRAVATRLPELDWIVYEELPYGAEHPELVADALRELGAEGFHTEPAALDPGGASPAKAVALGCYRSQQGALGDRGALALDRAERYHRLMRRVPGGPR